MWDLRNCDPDRLMAAFMPHERVFAASRSAALAMTPPVLDPTMAYSTDDNEIQIWREDAQAQTDLADAQTRKMVAENALEITEQQQQETHRAHQRKLELQRLANEHEIAKMETIDMSVEASNEQNLRSMRFECDIALRNGWRKGLVCGTPIGWLIGLGSGLAIGFLF